MNKGNSPCFRYAMKFPCSAGEMGRMRSSSIFGYPSNSHDGQTYAHTLSETPCIPETPCKDLTPKIYVTEYTLPSWTALFARTAALVTGGGVLSHSAVVARK
jgi:hypothetical protein